MSRVGEAPPATVGDAVAAMARRLRAAGIETPRLDARLLVGRVMEVGPEAIIGYPERRLDGVQADRLEDLVGRRERHEPMARLLGVREFWSLPIGVDAHTLVPRPDSETIVEAALAGIPDRAAALRILDLGTGSGCLLLALLSELPNARGVGTDINPSALRTAAANAAALGLADRAGFVVADWAEGLIGPFDVVVSNPPYIVEAEIADLQPEVRDFEPRLALAGGADGLAAYRTIAAGLPGLLRPGGLAVLEVGLGQAADVAELIRAEAMQVADIVNDLAGIPRCVVVRVGDSTLGGKKSVGKARFPD